MKRAAQGLASRRRTPMYEGSLGFCFLLILAFFPGGPRRGGPAHGLRLCRESVSRQCAELTLARSVNEF